MVLTTNAIVPCEIVMKRMDAYTLLSLFLVVLFLYFYTVNARPRFYLCAWNSQGGVTLVKLSITIGCVLNALIFEFTAAKPSTTGYPEVTTAIVLGTV